MLNSIKNDKNDNNVKKKSQQYEIFICIYTRVFFFFYTRAFGLGISYNYFLFKIFGEETGRQRSG